MPNKKKTDADRMRDRTARVPQTEEDARLARLVAERRACPIAEVYRDGVRELATCAECTHNTDCARLSVAYPDAPVGVVSEFHRAALRWLDGRAVPAVGAPSCPGFAVRGAP